MATEILPDILTVSIEIFQWHFEIWNLAETM